MDPTATTEGQTTDAPPPHIPLAFSCAIWVPTFAVVLYMMMRLVGPRAILTVDEEDEKEA